MVFTPTKKGLHRSKPQTSGYGLHSDQKGFTSIQTPNLRVWSSLRPKKIYIDPNPKPQGMVFTPTKKGLHRGPKPKSKGNGPNSAEKGLRRDGSSPHQGGFACVWFLPLHSAPIAFSADVIPFCVCCPAFWYRSLVCHHQKKVCAHNPRSKPGQA